MADVLSQNQIDELLNSLTSATDSEIKEIEQNTNTRKVKSYDFRMPKKFTKEQLRLLDRIFESYARLLSSYFTSMLRLYCKVEVLQIEEQRYYEFNNALPEYVMMGIGDLGTNDDEIDDTMVIIQISNPITMSMMDRLLGGMGAYVDVSRDFTEIEIGLMKTVIGKMTTMLKEPWSFYIDVNPELTTIETNSRVIQTIAPEDVVILAILEIEMKNIKNNISICIPAINLEQIMAKFHEKSSKTSKRFDAHKDADRRNEIISSIKNSPVDIQAILCETEVDMQDLLTLQVNDIIPLNLRLDSNVDIYIGGKKWFDGKLGLKGNKKAVMIDNIFGN